MIEDLYLDFSFPGYPEISDFSLHSSVTLANKFDYITFIKNTILNDGVALQFAWIKLGLNEVWPDATRGLLRIFSPLELESLWVGDQQNLPWKLEDLQKAIRFDHGFTNHSRTALNFLSVLSKFDAAERRQFLLFITGCPRLPLGGFANLDPLLTVVKKDSSLQDATLPSVMTCANYLKLPDYSSEDLLYQKLKVSMFESSQFHLS